MKTQFSGDCLNGPFKKDLPLWQVFWLIFVPAPVVLYGVYSLFFFFWNYLSQSFLTFAQLSAVTTFYSTGAMALMLLLGKLVWKCSFNTQRILWGYMARFAVASYLIWYGVKVSAGWWIFFYLH